MFLRKRVLEGRLAFREAARFELDHIIRRLFLMQIKAASFASAEKGLSHIPNCADSNRAMKERRDETWVITSSWLCWE